MANATDANVAYQQLRGMILRTELEPGAPLNEGDLTKRLGVGRTPLRDAMHSLEYEGLVEILPRRGTFVSQVTVSDLQQIFEVRTGIEDIVAQLAASRLTDQYLKRLSSLIARSKRTVGEESNVDLDSEFHALLLEIAGNRYLSEMYQRLADASLRLLFLTQCGMEPPVEQVVFFERARDALKGGDGGALSEVLRSHVRAFRDRVSGSLFVGATAGRDEPTDSDRT